MSTVGGGDIPKPTSEHADQILGTFWPESSESAWEHFSTGLKNEAMRLFQESEGPQKDIYKLVATDQEGAFIDSAVALIQRRSATLENRYEAYKRAATAAKAVASEIWAAKLKMAESVSAAEATITAARNELEPQIQAAQAAGQSAIAMSLKLELQARIQAAIHLGQMEVEAASGLAAGEIGTQQLGLAGWKAPNQFPSASNSGTASPMSNGTGVPAAPPPPMPASGGSGGIRNVSNDKYDVGDDDGTRADPRPGRVTQAGNNQYSDTGDRTQHGSHIEPAAAVTNGNEGSSLAPSSPSQASSGPGSLIGHMMSPLSSASGGSSAGGGSPLSSMGSGLGQFGNMGGANPASAQSASLANPAAAGLPAAGTGAGTGAGAGSGGGAGLAGLGAGAAETSARLATGAATGVANGLNAVANAGSQVAQNVAPAVAQIAAQSAPLNPAAVTTPASAGGMGGAPPMGMMPGGGMGGAPPVSSVGGSPLAGPATPSTPPTAPPPAGGAPSSLGSAPPGAQVAPLAMPQSHGGIRSIGADGATGTVLVDQAMGVGADLIAAMLTQTVLAGYIPIDFAVSLIYERTGGVTAWLATSEGASAIPLGVRIPQDVKLAVNDPIIGRELWSMAAAGGGANPLQIIAEHAKAREMAAPGTRVLAIASATPGVDEWAKDLGAEPVQLDAGKVRPVADLGHTLHRCEVSMPWEWRQANAFDSEDRLRIAARHMHMAVIAGHLNGAACEKVMRLFEERKPISDELWDGVHQERINALVDYDMTRMRLSYGAAELARQLATVRAAEVIESLRNFDTVEGCADLLYATRLAGAPLSPDAAAVA